MISKLGVIVEALGGKKSPTKKKIWNLIGANALLKLSNINIQIPEEIRHMNWKSPDFTGSDSVEERTLNSGSREPSFQSEQVA